MTKMLHIPFALSYPTPSCVGFLLPEEGDKTRMGFVIPFMSCFNISSVQVCILTCLYII